MRMYHYTWLYGTSSIWCYSREEFLAKLRKWNSRFRLRFREATEKGREFAPFS
jgi:hypothetical protein